MLLSSMPPAQAGGNLKWIIVGVAFLAAAAAMYLVMRPNPEPPPDMAQIVEPPERPTAFEAPDLEIPEVVPDAGLADANIGKKIVYRYIRNDWDCSGSIAAATARAVVAENNAQVRNCYERALKQNHTLQGSVNLVLRVDQQGRVTGTQVGGSLRDNEVFGCVRRLAGSWHFPEPSGGRCAVINAPFSFTPRGQ